MVVGVEEIRSYRDLVVWQKGLELTKAIYQLTTKLPENEKFGLVSQVRRAAVSIPSNIAEGRERGTRKDYAQFLRIALGSTAELDTQLLLIESVYPEIDTTSAQAEITHIRKMLYALIKKLNNPAP